jgi:hypothetical protein
LLECLERKTMIRGLCKPKLNSEEVRRSLARAQISDLIFQITCKLQVPFPLFTVCCHM